MKRLLRIWIAVCFCAPAITRGSEDVTNRLSLSARFGFNISARFKGLNTLPPPTPAERRTAHGDLYNYDDGYVLTDSTGNFGGQTWYWGYDDSSRQVSGNNILMSRTTFDGGAPSTSVSDDPSYGAELVYNRQLGAKGRLRYGIELAANYLNLSLSDSHTLSGNLMRTTYPYPFTPGTTPPTATPNAPYQGSFEGPGFVIGDTPGDPTVTTIIGGAQIEGHRQFDADIFGFRLGPYLEWPLGEHFRVAVSGGLAGAWLDGSASWNETVSIGGVKGATVSGDGHADDFLWGFYIAANAAWQFSERWSVVGGVQFQDLNNFNHSFGGREVEVDMSKSIYVTLGLSFNF